MEDRRSYRYLAADSAGRHAAAARGVEAATLSDLFLGLIEVTASDEGSQVHGRMHECGLLDLERARAIHTTLFDRKTPVHGWIDHDAACEALFVALHEATPTPRVVGVRELLLGLLASSDPTLARFFSALELNPAGLAAILEADIEMEQLEMAT